MPAKINLAPAVIAVVRPMYDAGEPYRSIAVFWNVCQTTARKYVRRLGFPPRPRARARTWLTETKSAGRPETGGTAADGSADSRSLSRRAEAAVRNQLGAIEQRLDSLTDASAEKSARVLASLVRSLSVLRKLEREDAEWRKRDAGNESGTDGQAGTPLDVARLRTELAEDLARKVQEEQRARDVPGLER